MRKFFSDFIFLLHALFVIFWYGLFFVPLSLWSGKISFHFFLTLAIVGNQFLWGFLIMPWTKKYRMVCFLTTIMQLLRGQKISDPKNYNHSFTKEFFGKTGLNIPHRGATLLTFTILTVVTIQYFFFR